MKKFAVILLVCLFCISSVACNSLGDASGNDASVSKADDKGDTSKTTSSKSGKIPTIRFATMNNRAESQLNWIKNWANENSDKINLAIEIENGNDLRTKLTTDMASNNLPDIWTYWSKGSLKQYTDHDLLLPIDEYLAESETISRDDYPNYGWEGMSVDGVCYGVPYQGSTVIWFANKSLFEQYNLEIPKTYQELLDCAKVFSADDIPTLGVGSLHGDGIYVTFSQIFYQYEDMDTLFAAVNEKDKFASSIGVQNACKYIVDMAQNGVFPKDTVANGSWTPCVSLYNENKCAILPNMTWTAAQISTDIDTVPIDCIEFPDSAKDPSTFTCGGTNNGVVALKSTWEDNERHDALRSFMDAYFSDDCEALLFEDGYNACMKIGIERPQELSSAENLFEEKSASYQEQYTLSWNFFGIINPREVFMNNLDALMAQTMSPEDFIETVQTAINDSLE